MKILLIDILRTSLEEVWPSAEHSLGLMYLAARLRREFGSRVDVTLWPFVSARHRSESETNTLRDQLEHLRPDLVGMRCLSIGKDVFHAAARTVKEWNPGCFLVAGGPYPTDDPADALGSGLVDCAVVGEGELTLNELVGRLLAKGPWEDIRGIVRRAPGGVLRTPPRQLIADLDSLPLPDYSLIDLERFSNQFLTFTAKISKPHGNIMTTRGCPYRCAYCHNILGKTFRARSPGSVLAEMRFLYDTYGLTDFQIIDDIFNLDVERAKTICDLIIRSGMHVTLSFPNALRGDRIDEELIEKLAAAGTKFISYAVETASPRLQKLIRKNLNLERIFTAIEKTSKAGIVTRGFFMIGFPTETEEEVQETIEFAKASALCGATFFTVVYFPGTELFRLAQSLGYFQGADVQRDYVDVGEGPYAFDLATLTSLKKKAIREFAFTRERIHRALTLLPGYFTQREIDGFFMAYVVSSRASLEEIADEDVRTIMRRYFLIADKFSSKSEFYV
jgi:anaerobic magnesium-protoporphyrin IX monomethyl ester cyclase